MRLWHLIAIETRARAGVVTSAIVVTAAVLSAIAVRFGAQDYKYRSEEFTHLVQQRETAQANDQWLMGWNTQFGLRAVRPPAPLSVFVRGLDGSMPTFWDFHPSGSIEGPPGRSVAQNSEAGSLVDLESVVRQVLGLLAVVLAIDATAGARASGTLRALLSQPVGPRFVALGKILSAAIILSLAIGLVLTVATLTLWASGRELVTPEIFAFLAAFGGTSLAYLLGLYLACLAIGSVAREYRRAAGLTLAVWVYAAFIGPQVTIFGVRAVLPVQPAQITENERASMYGNRLLTTEHLTGDRLIELLNGVLPSVIGELHVRPDVLAAVDRVWVADAAETRAMVDAINDRAARPAEAQRRAMTWLAWTNPGTAFVEAAADLANTGRGAEARWRRDVGAYQGVLNVRVFDDRPRLTLYIKETHGGVMTEALDRRAILRAAEFPPFSPTPAPLIARLRESTGHLLVIGGYLAALLAAAVFLFPRAAA